MFKESKPWDRSPYDDPDIYPGPRPASSFIFYNGQAHRIVEKAGTPIEECLVHVSQRKGLLGSLAFSSREVLTVADFLEKEKHAPVTERIPLLGYGSNVCLAQLAYKYGMTPESSDLIICLRATIRDSDIVYGSFLAPYGSLPAIIAPVQGAETEIWLTLVDQEQFDHMTSTEGGYELREHHGGKCIMQTGEQFEKVYGYYKPCALQIDGRMRRFCDIPGQSPLPAEWEADMLNWLKDVAQFPGAREHFIHKLRWDYSFHRKVNEMLQRYEVSFEHPDLSSARRFDTLGKMKRPFA